MRNNFSFILPQEIYYTHLTEIQGISFTSREIEVISCVINMRGASKAASFLSIAPRAIESHISNIRRKLEGKTREGIIDFIESSDKASIIRNDYYQSLRIRYFFEEKIKKIHSNEQKKCYVIELVSANSELSKLLKKQIIKHLEITHIEVLLPKNELINELEIQPDEHAIVITTKNKLNELDVYKLQNFTFIVIDEEIEQNEILFNTKNYYYCFFSVLSKLFPDNNINSVISEFEKLPSFKFEEIEQKTDSKQSTASNYQIKIKSIFNRKTWLIIFFITFVVSVFAFNHWFPVFRFSHVLNIENQSKPTARCAISIPRQELTIARPNLIDQIKKYFERNNSGIVTIAFVGVGGAGKTTLARRYASQQKSGIIWEINAESQESLKESFNRLAKVLCNSEEERKTLKSLQEIKNSLEQNEAIIRFVKEKMKLNSNWFLIYENVEKFSDTQKYFPNDYESWGRGQIIITTRDSNIENNSYVNKTFQVNELSSEEKLNFFMKLINTEGVASFTEERKTQAQKFLNNIPSFPLDIAVAAYYLKATNISYEKYLDNLREYSKEFADMQKNVLKDAGDYTQTRYSIITLSLKQLIDTNKDFKNLLLLISVLDSQNIPRDLLDSYGNNIITDSFIYNLKKYSLITDESNVNHIPTFSLHRSMQEISLKYLINILSAEKNNYSLKSIIEIVDNYITKAVDQENFQKMKLAITHCETLLSQKIFLDDITKASLRGVLGCAYYYLSDCIKAKQFLEQSIEVFHGHENGNCEKIGRILVYLSNVYRELGQIEKAKTLLEQSISAYQKHNDPSFGLGRALGYLGIVYRGLGEFTKATHFMKQSLSIYEKNTENNVGLAWISAHLGATFMISGQYEEAKILLERSLSMYQKQSEDYVGAGWVSGYLGNVYRKIGLYEKARTLLEQSLKICEKHFSKNHAYRVTSLVYLGNLYIDLGNDKKAEQLIEEGLKIYKKTYGENRVETARVFNDLGKVYLMQSKVENAEQIIKKALEIFQQEKYYGSYEALENLADIYLKKSIQATGDQTKEFKTIAIEYLKKSLEIAEKHFPENSFHVVRIQKRVKEHN